MPDAISPSPVRLLLIEDNPDDAVYVSELLDGSPPFPHELESADTLQGGLNKLAEHDSDLVLLDLSLPDSFGLQTLESAMKHSPGVPIIIMTGNDEVETGTEAVRIGAQDYLVKGQLSQELLRRTIRHAIQRHHAQQELLKRENDIRLLTDQLPAVLWTTNCDLAITSSLGAGLTRLNLLPNQVSGMTIAEYFEISPEQENAEPLQAHIRALGGQSVSFETRLRGRTHQAHVEPWRPGGGPIAGVIGVALDVTERRMIEEEMLIARHIQQTLLPSEPPELPGFDVAGVAQPAEACSGDFFDFLVLPDGTLAAILGDVSGHGFGPAILTASAHSYFRALSRTESDLAKVIKITNNLLVDDSPPEQYLTLFLQHINAETRTLRFLGAGHPSGFVLDSHGEVRLRLKSSWSPMGWFQESDYELSDPIHLNPGELVLMLTDGILEAFSADKIFFGAERVLACLKNHRTKPAREILENLLAEVREFIKPGKQRDDMTAVLIKVDE